MKTLTTKTREELQFAITTNNALCTSVQSIERLKEFHFSIYNKYFSDKTEGYVYNKMNINGTWAWRWFARTLLANSCLHRLDWPRQSQ